MPSLDFEFGKPDPNSSEPVYLQIVRRFKELILQNKLQDGGEAPSRRMLAASLGVNPNTVQKAFAELEREGLIVTPPNAKSVICAGAETLTRLRAELLDNEAAALVATAKGAGMDYKRLMDIISAKWEDAP